MLFPSRPLIATLFSLSALLAGATAPRAQAERTLDLSGFAAVDISTGLDATITPGDSFAITLRADSRNSLDQVVLEVKDGTLYASRPFNLLNEITSGRLFTGFFSSPPDVQITITMPAITALDSGTGAHVTLSDFVGSDLRMRSHEGGDIRADRIAFNHVTLQAATGASLAVRGKCKSTDQSVSTGADIEAAELVCQQARADASTGGSVSLYARTRLDASASTGGSITVYGAPEQVSSEESLGGSIDIIP